MVGEAAHIVFLESGARGVDGTAKGVVDIGTLQARRRMRIAVLQIAIWAVPQTGLRAGRVNAGDVVSRVTNRSRIARQAARNGAAAARNGGGAEWGGAETPPMANKSARFKMGGGGDGLHLNGGDAGDQLHLSRLDGAGGE